MNWLGCGRRDLESVESLGTNNGQGRAQLTSGSPLFASTVSLTLYISILTACVRETLFQPSGLGSPLAWGCNSGDGRRCCRSLLVCMQRGGGAARVRSRVRRAYLRRLLPGEKLLDGGLLHIGAVSRICDTAKTVQVVRWDGIAFAVKATSPGGKTDRPQRSGGGFGPYRRRSP
jgi:hypothetical protein